MASSSATTLDAQTIDVRDGGPRFAVVRPNGRTAQPSAPPVGVIRITAADARLARLLRDPLASSRWESATADERDVIEPSLVVDEQMSEPIAALAGTDVDLRNGHARIVFATMPSTQAWRRMLQGTATFVDRLFAGYPFAKLYLQLLDGELDRVRSGLGRTLAHEATMRGHLFWCGERLDVHTLAIDRESWEAQRGSGAIIRAVERLLHSDHVPLDERAEQFVRDVAGTHAARHDLAHVEALRADRAVSELGLEDDLGMDALSLAELDTVVSRRQSAHFHDGRDLCTVGDVVSALAAPGIQPLFSPS